MEKYQILFVGESWFFTTTETKGTDQFSIGGYQTEIGRIREYMSEFAELTHIPAHRISEDFPDTCKGLEKYDVVMISDVGANTFLLHPDTFFRSQPTVNKLDLIEKYVRMGGAFGMAGGYMTFMGIEGKAQYKNTAIEKILPVTMKEQDDRRECPQGFAPKVVDRTHPAVKGLDGQWPLLLGYNEVQAKPEGQVLLAHGDAPILVTGSYGEGKTFAWTSDCAPHWMPDEFCSHDLNKRMWKQLFGWCSGKDV